VQLQLLVCLLNLALLDKQKFYHRIFGHEGTKADDVIYSNWLAMIFAGAAKSLEMYQPNTNSWMQAHSQARFAILQVLLEAGEDFVTVEEKTGSDGKPDLLISVDRSKIDTVGRKAISDFLLKIQVRFYLFYTLDFSFLSKQTKLPTDALMSDYFFRYISLLLM